MTALEPESEVPVITSSRTARQIHVRSLPTVYTWRQSHRHGANVIAPIWWCLMI